MEHRAPKGLMSGGILLKELKKPIQCRWRGVPLLSLEAPVVRNPWVVFPFPHSSQAARFKRPPRAVRRPVVPFLLGPRTSFSAPRCCRSFRRCLRSLLPLLPCSPGTPSTTLWSLTLGPLLGRACRLLAVGSPPSDHHIHLCTPSAPLTLLPLSTPPVVDLAETTLRPSSLPVPLSCKTVASRLLWLGPCLPFAAEEASCMTVSPETRQRPAHTAWPSNLPRLPSTTAETDRAGWAQRHTMAFSSPMGDRNNDIRFRSPQSPRDESMAGFPSVTSPLQGIAGPMPPRNPNPSQSESRASLTRRFTTNALPTVPTLSPLSPIGQQRRQAVEPPDLTSAVSRHRDVVDVGMRPRWPWRCSGSEPTRPCRYGTAGRVEPSCRVLSRKWACWM
jgi:hypothetical protein